MRHKASPIPTITSETVVKRKTRRAFRRTGKLSNPEKDIIANIVHEQTSEMTSAQTSALAKVLKRSPEMVRQAVTEARDRFVERAGRYVDIHMQATESALDSGDVEQALKGSQWALTNISGEGARVVDKPSEGSSGVKVMVGVKIGGLSDGTAVKVSDVDIT